jgi:acetyl-CoA C-acetyltransferase
MKVEAACASGAAALRVGTMAVASGMHDVVLVCGVEKMTDTPGAATTSGLATAADQEYEVSQGVSFVGLNALLMQRYMYEYQVPHEAFAAFTVNAHRNAVNNPYAMFQSPVSQSSYAKAAMVADPINLMDSSPMCDGAACVVLAPAGMFRSREKVRVLASATATDSLAVHDRRNPLYLEAVARSTQKAYAQSGLTPDAIHLFEVHDAFSIMAALSLEAAGFAPCGGGVNGHPVGATGVYQVVEVVEQLCGAAGKNQVQGATIGMAQNIGGSGATVVTHILGAA